MADPTLRQRSPRDAVDAARERTAGVLDGFTTGQKTTTVLAVLALVVAGAYFMRWAAAPTMAPLFSNLAPADAAAITGELDGMGATYELADGGRTILVDRADQAALRLDMSGAGLMPEGGSGFALLDDHGVTTSEFIQNVDYQRAVEGELATTIGAMDIVESARVHLVMPADDLFLQDNQMATASVMLALRGGATPTPMQIQSIVNLVAGSVEGLEPTRVTVTDTDGAMLAAPGEEGQLAALGDARQFQTASFESRLASDVETMLQRVVGPDAAVVSVAADLDFDTVAETSETFGDGGPATGIPLESTVTNETFTGIGADQTGILGPDGQILGGGAGEETTYALEDGTTRFAVDRTVREILAAPGAVNRLSVAVLIDEGAGGADAAAVQALVEAAVGFDAARGDVVEVSALPFDTTAADAAAEAAEAAAAAASQAQMMDLVRMVGAIVIVLVVLLLAWRSARRAIPAREPRSIPLDLAELDAGDDDDDAIAEFEFPVLETGPSITDEVAHMIDAQGEEMAGILRGWMAEK